MYANPETLNNDGFLQRLIHLLFTGYSEYVGIISDTSGLSVIRVHEYR